MWCSQRCTEAASGLARRPGRQAPQARAHLAPASRPLPVRGMLDRWDAWAMRSRRPLVTRLNSVRSMEPESSTSNIWKAISTSCRQAELGPVMRSC